MIQFVHVNIKAVSANGQICEQFQTHNLRTTYVQPHYTIYMELYQMLQSHRPIIDFFPEVAENLSVY